MRGGRTGWYSPLLMVLLALMIVGCNLDLKVAEPYLQLQIAVLYNPPNPVPFQYKFFADEPVLRCRYALSRDGTSILEGQTEPETSGVWHERSLQVPDLAEGPYQIDLVVQAERSKQFVDLEFLKKSVSFYVDTKAPEAPGVDLPDNVRYTEPKSVHFSHPEWPVPLVSPVKVYYTTDGTDPASSATRILYDGLPAPLPFDRGVMTLKAIAEDEAGNQSSINEVSYYFIHINSIDPAGESTSYNQNIDIYGFGFTGVTSSGDITMTDSAGTPRELFFSSLSISENKIYFRADLLNPQPAPVGTAIISITNNDQYSATVTVPFQVIPPPP
jgi:hypothetical protein